jgi:hypothetical protein
MDATTRLLLVLAAAALPIGVIPLTVWLHDMVIDLVEASAWTLLLLVADRATAGDDYQGADAD